MTSLRSHHGIPRITRTGAKSKVGSTSPKQLPLGVSSATLRLAIERGEIEAEHPVPNGPWVLNRRALETAGAAQLTKRARKNTRGAKKTPALATDEQGVLDLSVT